MNLQPQSRNLILIFALSLFSLVLNAEDTSIYIESMSNSSNVAILGTQVSNTVEAGQVLNPGNRLQTRDSSARIVYPDGSLVTLGKNSEVEIKNSEEDSGTKKPISISFLKTGFIHARIHHQDGDSPHFYIETRTAVVGVRGTEFTLSSSESEEAKIHVLEGKVAFAVDHSKIETAAQNVSTGQLANSKAGAITPPEVFNLAEYRKTLSVSHPEVHKLIYNKIKNHAEATQTRHKSRRRHK